MHPGTGADGGNEEIMVFGLSDLDTDEEGNLRSADAGALDYYAPEHSELAERQSELGFE